MSDAEAAAHELDRWICEARASGIEPLVRLADKIEKHRQNILNSIDCHANSSQSESCNALIKILINIGRGFRNLSNLFSLIFLRCSQLVVPLHNRPQLTAEQLEQRRIKARENRLKRQQAKVNALNNSEAAA